MPECLLWDAAEVAEALGVSVRTVKYWSLSGRLPGFVSLNGRARWQRSVVESWVAGGCRTVQDDADSKTDDDSQAVIDNLG